MPKSRLDTPEHFTIPLSPQLYRLVLLKDGWDGEGSKAITKEALEALNKIIVRPTKDGGIELEFVADKWDCILHIKPNGETY